MRRPPNHHGTKSLRACSRHNSDTAGVHPQKIILHDLFYTIEMLSPRHEEKMIRWVLIDPLKLSRNQKEKDRSVIRRAVPEIAQRDKRIHGVLQGVKIRART